MPRTLRLNVPMHCHNCAERIEDRVVAVPGVQQVDADHRHDLVTVEHADEVFEGQIRATLAEMGFDAEGPVHPKEEASP